VTEEKREALNSTTFLEPASSRSMEYLFFGTTLLQPNIRIIELLDSTIPLNQMSPD
jgi:hypothetical protein